MLKLWRCCDENWQNPADNSQSARPDQNMQLAEIQTSPYYYPGKNAGEGGCEMKYTAFIRDGKAVCTNDESFQRWYAADKLQVLASGLTPIKAKQMMRIYNKPEEAVKLLKKFWRYDRSKK